MSLAPGTRLGSYEIVAPLGAGGMGEVLRARDTKLGRDVAIKILPDAFAGDAERLARFEREAKTLAALNHPHIAQIYGFEQTGNTAALIMELVEGEDLATRLKRGPIALGEVLPIARQLAAAIEAAHEQRIVHRDLKPANIMLRADGTVKVLDFGLAKALGPDPMPPEPEDPSRSPTITTPAMTERGVVLGTAAYMSPEQARGLPVDERTDVWAFGALLYELLTGARAFPGPSATETFAQVLEHEPDWTKLPATTSSPVRALLQRCLNKNPRERLRHIGDARFAIEEALALPSSTGAFPTAASSSGRARRLAWAAAGGAILLSAIAAGWLGRPAGPGGGSDPAVPPRGMSVAVLAFVNMSGNPENEYLGDGLAEEIINVIARSGVRVVARTSAFSFKGKNTDVREIGRQLGVGAIVEGSVRQSGERLRVTAQLIRADDGSHLWSETFDRPAGDLFAIEDEIAGAVLRSVAPAGVGLSVATARVVRDPQAYEFYLRGRYEGRTWSRDGLERAERLFEQAVARDPAFGDAWGALADAVILRHELHQVRSRDEASTTALAAARQSLASSPPSADGYAALAHMQWHDGQWSAVEQDARRALALNPGSATGHEMLGFALATVGRLEEAEAEHREAIALDPLTAAYHYNLAAVLQALGRFEDALASLDRDVAIAGTYRNPNVLRRIVDCLVSLRRVDEADRRVQALGDVAPAIAGLQEVFRARLLAARGREREAREALASFTSTVPNVDGSRGNAQALVVAWAYAAAGDTQAAVDWIGRADPYRRREWLALFRFTAEVQRISDHPRLQAFFAEAGLRGLPATGAGTPDLQRQP